MTLTVSTAFGQMNPNKLNYVECHSDRGIIAKAIIGDASLSNEGQVEGWLVANLLSPVEVDCSATTRNRLRQLLKERNSEAYTDSTLADAQVLTSLELCKNKKRMSIYVLNMGPLAPLRLLCRSIVSVEFIRPSINQIMNQVAEIDSSSATAPLFVTTEQYARIKPQLLWMKPASP